jgi:methyl-accepting chemotaxis protein
MAHSLKFSHKILIATSIVVTIAFTAFTGLNSYVQRQAIRDSLDYSLKETGQLAATNVALWFDAKIKLLESEVQAIGRDGSPSKISDLLEQKIYTENFESTYFADDKGKIIIRPDTTLPAGFDPRTRPWYKAATGAESTVLTPPYVFESTGELGITVASPLSRYNHLPGVVAGDLSLIELIKTITSLNVGGLGEALLLDGDGKILVSKNKQYLLKNIHEIFPDLPSQLTTNISETSENGVIRIINFTPITGLPTVNWYLGLSVDKSKAFAATARSQKTAIIATAVSIILIIALLTLLIRVLLQPLRDLTSAMNNIADGEGDLTQRLPLRKNDEFGMLAQAFNRFVERIHLSISDVAKSTNRLNQVSSQVMAATTASLQQSDSQAQRSNSVATAINQLGAATHEIARNAAFASNEATSARTQANEGRHVLDQALDAMQNLSLKIGSSCEHIEALDSKASNIGQILDVIRGISEQTNLLALNAAIEAARAGEAGRGFAVVADEVRSLAQRTQSSAQQIQEMIEELQGGSRNAVSLMNVSQQQCTSSVEVAQKAQSRLSAVTERIGEIDGQNQSVATATEEQSAVVETLNVDVSEINSLNQKSIINLQATLQACSALDAEATQLQKLVMSFRI